MSTTSNLTSQRDTKTRATRAWGGRRLTIDSLSEPRPPAVAPRSAEPAPFRQPAGDGRPRGHVVGHAIGTPPPVSLEGRPRGHVVAHG
jgi:hypothetical protein